MAFAMFVSSMTGIVKRFFGFGFVVILFGGDPRAPMNDYNRAWQLNGQLRVDEAIPLFQAIIAGDKTFYRAYMTLAEAYSMKDADKGVRYFQSLLAQDATNALAHYGLGRLYDFQQKAEAAVESYNRCVQTNPEAYVCYHPLATDRGSKELKRIVPWVRRSKPSYYLALGELCARAHKMPESNQAAETGVELARAAGELDLVILFEDLLADNYAWMANPAQTVRYREEALRVTQSLGDWEGETKRRQELALAYIKNGSFERGVAFLEETLTFTRERGHRFLEAANLWYLGDIYRGQADRDRALYFYRNAQHLFEQIGRPLNALLPLLAIAELHFEAGDFSAALRDFEECRASAAKLGHRWVEAFAMKGLANAHRELGNYFQALVLQADAIRIFEQLGRKMNIAATMRDAGAVYAAMGAYGEARSRYALSLERSREALDIEGQQRNLINLADLALREDQPSAVLRYLGEEFALGTRNDYAPFRCRALLKMGSAHLMLGQGRLALRDWNQALLMAREFRLQPEEVAVLTAEGHYYLKIGSVAVARARFSAGLALAERAGLAQRVLEARRGLAETSRREGDYDEALRQLALTVRTVEALRSRIPGPELRAGFVQDNWKIYEDLINVLSVKHLRAPTGHYDRLAFEYAERARARSFLDLLAESKAQITKGLTEAQLTRQGELFAKLSETSAALMRQRSAENRRAVDKAEQDLAGWSLQLRRTNPQYQQLHYPEPFRVEQAQETAAQLGGVIIEYWLGERRSLVWLTGRHSFQMAVLPGRAEIDRQVRYLRALIARRPSTEGAVDEYRRAASALYRVLIGPVSSGLSRGQNLIFVPDGILHYLPFEALLASSGRYLTEDHAVVYSPSASVVGNLSDGSRPNSYSFELLAYGDPVFDSSAASAAQSRTADLVRGVYAGMSFAPLPNTRREIDTISRTIPVSKRRVYLGQDATEASVKHERLEAYRMLHFATHAVLDEQAPAMSGVVLSLAKTGGEDGILRVNEIFNLELNADLVTLSACQTGLGKLVRGEGVIGLTRAFLYAGARRVTVSLWEVNDMATADFMGIFYRKMQGGMSAVLALRQAKLAMLRSEVVAYRHPYFWAPFVVVGSL